MKKPSATAQAADAVSRTATSAARMAFDASIDASQSWLIWISEAGSFDSILRNRIPWEQLSGPEVAVVQARLKSASPPSSLLLNSFYVTMVAGFEEYLRCYIREQAQKITTSRVPFNNLNVKLQRMTMRESARLLKRLDMPPDYITFDENALCRQLGTCVPDSKHVELNGDALAEVDGLLKLVNFMDRIEIFEKRLSWDEFGGQQSIKAALNMPRAGVREIGKALESELNLIARYRNRIAHTGGAASDVTSPILTQHRELLASIVKVIDAL